MGGPRHKKEGNTKYAIHKGDRFGKLTAISKAVPRRHGRQYWRCRCDCGETTTVRDHHLYDGGTISCGCHRRQRIANRNRTHGKKGIPEYEAWIGMRSRCKSNLHYINKGITVCKRWSTDFLAFLEDMGKRPPGTSLDRINNNLGYSPDNCRWATPSQQCRNKSNNRLLTYKGVTMCVADWVDELGIPRAVLSGRIDARGWSIDRAFETPYKPLGKRNVQELQAA